MDLACSYELVKQLSDVLHFWQQLLNYSAERLVNSMIIDACQVITNLHFGVLAHATNAEFTKQASHVLRYFIQHVDFLFISLEKVRVNFVDKHFKSNCWINFMGNFDDFEKFIACIVFVWLVCINNVYK